MFSTRLKMMKSLRVFPLLMLAVVLVACGGSKRNEAASRGGGVAGNARDDDIPTNTSSALYVDHYRFGDATDASGKVVRETSVIPPGSTAAMSFYVRNVPTGTEVRIVWKDLTKNADIGDDAKPVSDKGFVTFKQAKPLPEGSYRVGMYVKQPKSKEWQSLGTHDFRVGHAS